MNDEAQWQNWRQQRQQTLTAPDAWLSLVGLYWLEPGPQTLGSAPDNQIHLAAGPAHWGQLHLGPDGIQWQTPGNPPQSLHTDHDGQPDVVRAGEVSFILIERDGQIALRLRDNANPLRQQFGGVPYFDYDPRWKISARWDPTPQTLIVATMSGGLETRQLPGKACFQVEGDGTQGFTLTPLESNEQGLFFVFADATSGKKDGQGSYGAGRFLWAEQPQDGQLVLDFNRAYNPPCAFTPFATCPLAPPENRLPFAVKAGEMYSPDA